ncbi:MAG: glycosyltransferase involved in cell wall biosynthesis [Candidatus Poriferisodalaceae bacterium]|jgi:glycosyltransferase involved in cell wall biosynthesis
MHLGIFAYDCIPSAGSDPGLGFQSVEMAHSLGHRLHVFTRASNRAAIEAGPDLPEATFVYVDVREKIGPASSGQPHFDVAHIARFLKVAVDQASSIHLADPFDLTQHATFSAFWMSGANHRLGVPHLHGPMTGGESNSDAFIPYLSKRERLDDLVREPLIRTMMRRPAWKKTVSAPHTKSVVASELIKRQMLAAGAGEVEVHRSPYAVPPELRESFAALAAETPKLERPVFVTSGRQLRWKGTHWAVRALPRVLAEIPEATLRIIGGGPNDDAVNADAERLGVTSAVERITGVDRWEERRLLAECQALVFPSQRDSGGVILQFAMALGLPVVGFGVGMAPSILGDAGLLVDPGSSATPDMALADAMIEMSTNATARAEMAKAGPARVAGATSYESSRDAYARWIDDLGSRR